MELSTIYKRSFFLIIVISFLTLAGVTSAISAEQTWLKDPITGCSVWNNNPENSESVISWSGHCVDGQASGTGVLVWFEQGKLKGRFSGTMVAGKAEEFGKLDLLMEQGYANYVGEFKDNQITGWGEANLPDKSRIKGEFDKARLNGFVEYFAANGDGYKGQVEDNLPHGLGRQTLEGVEEYYGDFVHGVREGQGTLLLASGDAYVGVFHNGKPHGLGELRTVEGGLYKGPFAEGVPHGEGVFYTPDGDVARGRVEHGQAEGKILITKQDGTVEEQHWSNGKKVQP